MDRRGGTTFALLFVVNPVLILFFQNCSMAPSKEKPLSDILPQRQISSEAPQECKFVALSGCAE